MPFARRQAAASAPTITVVRHGLTMFTLACACNAQALTLQFTFQPGMPVEAQQAVLAAGAQWQSLLADPVSLQLSMRFTSNLEGALAATEAASIEVPYRSFRTLLQSDATSAADATAVTSLPASSLLPRLTNRTRDNPAGAGSMQPYVDRSTGSVSMTSANARALGITSGVSVAAPCPGSCDALVSFSSTQAFDFNRSDGIAPGRIDFYGVAVHEIGHALGFISNVDGLDLFSPPTAGPFDAAIFLSAPLDLFRYSEASAAAGVSDFTADTRAKYLSLDGGATLGPAFATGEVHGDGWQAGHWQNTPGLGALVPTLLPGQRVDISNNDLLALDVIGWQVTSAVPEPATVVMLAAGLLLIARRRP